MPARCVRFGQYEFRSISAAREHVQAFMDTAEDGALVSKDVLADWMLDLLKNHPDANKLLDPNSWTGNVIVRTFGGHKAPTARLVMHSQKRDLYENKVIETDVSLLKCIQNSIVTEDLEPIQQRYEDDEATSA